MVNKRTGRSSFAIRPRTVGAVAGVAGAIALAAYPLVVAGILPGSRRIPPGIPESTFPPIVLLSVIGGAVLFTWGAFAVRARSLRPLTPRRSLVAPAVALLGIATGAALFVVQWVGTTPIDQHGNVVEDFDPSLLELLRVEVTIFQFLALAIVAATVVGAVAARRGRRQIAASVALPLAIVALGVVWAPQSVHWLQLVVAGVLAAAPFAVGYATARSE